MADRKLMRRSQRGKERKLVALSFLRADADA